MFKCSFVAVAKKIVKGAATAKPSLRKPTAVAPKKLVKTAVPASGLQYHRSMEAAKIGGPASLPASTDATFSINFLPSNASQKPKSVLKRKVKVVLKKRPVKKSVKPAAKTTKPVAKTVKPAAKTVKPPVKIVKRQVKLIRKVKPHKTLKLKLKKKH